MSVKLFVFNSAREIGAGCLLLTLALVRGNAQVTLTGAVDLALRQSPRVKMAESEVDKARAGLSEAKDVYIPSLTGGSGLGYSYGFPVGQPSIFNFSAQSLVFNYSQHDYIRAAQFGVASATMSLRDAREAVAADAALTFVALDRDERRGVALREQGDFAGHLVSIVQDRLDAGRDTSIELTTARLSAAQIHLAQLRTEDETTADRVHLARLMGIPPDSVQVVHGTFTGPEGSSQGDANATEPSFGVRAAYSNARSKAETAFGDRRYLYRPQVAFGAQFARFTKYNNYDLYYQHFQANNAEIGVQITVPLFDRAHQAKARGSVAEAARSLHEADYIRDQSLDGEVTLRHSLRELRARAEVATLDQQLAQQQLAALLVQTTVPATATAPQMTPKDEQNARILERDKLLTVIETNLQMQQVEINLLRQTGRLEDWLKQMVNTTSAKP